MIFVKLLLSAFLVSVSGEKHSSSKRGLVYVYSDDQSDDSVWDTTNTDITWYYNYGAYPTSSLDLEFVPMLWGDRDSDTNPPFHETVKGLIDGGSNIKYVLGFNEPDLCDGTGGSCVSAQKAASIWREQIEPLKKLGVKLGAPSVTNGPMGGPWLADFFAHCDGKCTVDFLPLHWYGAFDYVPDYLNGFRSTYENISTIWVTEFADPSVSLEETQAFFNSSVACFDNTS